MTNKIIDQLISSIHQLFLLLRKSKDHSHQSDLSLIQMHALFYIKQAQNPTMSELSDRFGVTLPTTTKLIERLVNQNYLQRLTDSTDRRIIRLRLTPQGNNILLKIKDKKDTELKNLLSALTMSDIDHLQKIINKLLLNTEKKADE